MSSYITPPMPLARRAVPLKADSLAAMARRVDPEVARIRQREAIARANRGLRSGDYARLMRAPGSLK